MKNNKSLLIKSIIYRPYSEFVTFLIAFAITGKVKLSLAIGIANLFMKIFSYFIFDLFWNRFVKSGYKPCVVWLTGLSGAGKTTIANAIAKKLKSMDVKCIILDGDEIRNMFPSIGFGREARIEHNIKVAYMASILESQGYIVIVSLVSPYAEGRDKSRAIAKRFIEVYVSTPLSICEFRDVKGLYKRARHNEIPEFTGVSSPYEIPLSPELELDTNLIKLNQCVKKVIEVL